MAASSPLIDMGISIEQFVAMQKRLNKTRVSIPELPPIREPERLPSELIITITGQIRGGKNNYIVTRQGKHIPRKEWALWRDAKIAEVRSQLPAGFSAIAIPVTASLAYVAGDARRRDMPAILDSIFHILERAGVVTDDTFLWISSSQRAYDKQNPRAIITIPL